MEFYVIIPFSTLENYKREEIPHKYWFSPLIGALEMLYGLHRYEFLLYLNNSIPEISLRFQHYL